MKYILKGIGLVSLFTMSATLGLANYIGVATYCGGIPSSPIAFPSDFCSFPGEMSALATAGETLNGNSVQFSVGAYADLNVITLSDGIAFASGQVIDSLVTGGPLRLGVLDYTYTYTATPIWNSRYGASIDTFEVGGSCLSGSTCTVTGSVPVELGNYIYLDSVASVYRQYSVDGSGLSSFTSTFSASVFEADGTTAVPLIIQSPEPATFGSLGVAFFAGVAFLYRRRQPAE